MWDFPLFPESATAIARRVDAVYFFELAVCVFFTLLICVLILYYAIKYRKGSQASRANAVTHNLTLEVLWIAIPLAIALMIFAAATVVFFEMYRFPPDAPEVYVLGRQWMWEVRHPGGKREINELHIPVGQPVKLLMTSQDVIHSFYVPAFRVKQDVIPGRYTSMWFQPNRVGKYHLFCAEYCGTKHSGMIGWVVVMEPSEYQHWLESGTTEAPMAASGAQLFKSYGCSGCHGVNSTVRAPLLDGVYGHPVPLEGGSVITADEKYIRDSILLPMSQVVAGYKPVMPTYQGRISEDDLLKIITYIKGLGRNERVEQ
jgi:cytochrome c oxidase subunit II